MEYINNFKKYYYFFKVGLKKFFEYKLEAFNDFISSIIQILLSIVIWEYLFSISEIKSVGDLTYSQMIIYFVIEILILREFHTYSYSNSIEQLIREGDIQNHLAKPINPIISIWFKELGIRITSIIKNYFLFFIITIFFFSFTQNILVVILFIILVLELIIVNTIIDTIYGLFAFKVTKIWGLRYLFISVLGLLTGAFLPISMYPQLFQDILKYTPFYYQNFAVSMFYIGKMPLSEFFKIFIINVFYIILLIGISTYMYKKGEKKLVVFGA